jgi:hypothetical protein
VAELYPDGIVGGGVGVLFGSNGRIVLVAVSVADSPVGEGVLVLVGISVEVSVGGILVAEGKAIGGGNVGGNACVAVSSGVGVEASVGVGAGAAAVDKLQLNIARVIMMIPVIRLSVPLIISSKTTVNL